MTTTENPEWLQALTREFAPRELPAFWDDPTGWVRKYILWPTGQSVAAYQEEILDAVPKHGRVAVRAVHGAGKSVTASLLIIWFAITREQAGADWKCISTASRWQQLTNYLWPEIHKWAGRINWDLLDREPWNEHSELLAWSLKLKHGAVSSVASDKPSSIEGAHADELLYVFDEAKAILAETFDAAEGAFSGTGNCYALAISTPGEPFGRFYDIHARKPGLEEWQVKHVKVDEAIAAGRVSQKWVDQSRTLWGAESATYLNRVEGEFAAQDSDGVIPLAWVEAANLRWEEIYDKGTPVDHVLRPNEPVDFIGFDVADEGADRSVAALRIGNAVAELQRFPFSMNGLEAGRHVLQLQRAHAKVEDGTERRDYPRVIMDSAGMGSILIKVMLETSLPIEGFVASEKTAMMDQVNELGFVNKRAAGWWNLREMLDPTSGLDVALPPDDQLTGDLVAPKWREMSGGRIQVESKDDIRKRIGRSTDDGDAVVMSFWTYRDTSTQLIRTLRSKLPPPRPRKTFLSTNELEEAEIVEIPQPKQREKLTEDEIIVSRSKRKLRCKHFYGPPNPGTNERRCNTCGKTPEEAAED